MEHNAFLSAPLPIWVSTALGKTRGYILDLEPVDPNSNEAVPPAHVGASSGEAKIERGHRVFEKAIVPATASAVLISFSIQPLAPLFNSIINAFIGLSLALLCILLYARTIYEEDFRWLKWINWGLMLVSFALIGWQAYYMIQERPNKEAVCLSLESQFISKPDSNVSDAYSALHCEIWTHLSYGPQN